ncbi:hypothetical protein X798_02273 [Onchocerca flexuosa]|uniref:Uncharacterized protein n=1 Tax=Onchocerca flexuosa TaxID=387005 RepID=A0A238BZK8_9BILA|nr:hypothetical protein X798_02273 [Onchocerca flexuosa]
MIRPKILQIKSCIITSSPTLPLSTVSVKQEMLPKKETEKKDTKFDVQEKPKSSKCRNCQFMLSELKEFKTRARSESPVRRKRTEDDTKQEKSSSSTGTDNENEETHKWKALNRTFEL